MKILLLLLMCYPAWADPIFDSIFDSGTDRHEDDKDFNQHNAINPLNLPPDYTKKPSTSPSVSPSSSPTFSSSSVPSSSQSSSPSASPTSSPIFSSPTSSPISFSINRCEPNADNNGSFGAIAEEGGNLVSYRYSISYDQTILDTMGDEFNTALVAMETKLSSRLVSSLFEDCSTTPTTNTAVALQKGPTRQRRTTSSLQHRRLTEIVGMTTSPADEVTGPCDSNNDASEKCNVIQGSMTLFVSDSSSDKTVEDILLSTKNSIRSTMIKDEEVLKSSHSSIIGVQFLEDTVNELEEPDIDDTVSPKDNSQTLLISMGVLSAVLGLFLVYLGFLSNGRSRGGGDLEDSSSYQSSSNNGEEFYVS